MKRLTVLTGFLVLCVGCGRGPTDAGSTNDVTEGGDAGEATHTVAELSTPAEESPAQPGAEPSAAVDEPVLLGKALSYWTERAAVASGAEDRRRTVEALMLAFGQDAPRVRVEATDALEKLMPEAGAAAGVLVAQLEHENAWVRVAAMETLALIGEPAVAPLLAKVESGSRAGQRRSALVLGSIGPDAKAAIPALEKAQQDESSAVHDLAGKVLAAINPDAEAAETAREAVSLSVADTPGGIPASEAGDWPQFHGPRRDSLCAETGLLKQWPQGGPKLLWKLEGLGRGLSTVSIAGGRIFTMGDRTPPGEEEAQFVTAFDLDAREELWSTRVGRPYKDGPHCTPTVDGELLYVLGTEGDLICAEAATGNIRWQKSLPDDFGGRMMSKWKFSESPLVDGEKLVCTPGGEQAAIVALNKQTGESIWQSAVPPLGEKGNDGAGYASAVVAQIEGVRQYVQVLGRGVVGVEADSGRFLWGYNGVANTIANISSPLVWGNYVFASTAYGTGSALLRISRDGDAFTAEEVYFLQPKEFENHHGGVVLLGNYIYGGGGTNKGTPVCLDLATGEIAWKAKAPDRGSAAVVYADGHLIFRYDRGLVAWVEATPEEFRLKGTFEAVRGTGPAWPHPVIHQGKLYLRHNDLLLCYDLRAGE